MAAAQPAGDAAAAERLGQGVAILVGDLALALSDRLLHRAGLPPDTLISAQHLMALRSDLVHGEYLDLTAAGHSHPIRAALTIARYKTAKYTFEGPLRLGSVLAGAPQGLRTH
ncbi:polyprenyl synthetase family protein [Streptomyces sp. NBC_00539]|uniref:polyprenyl synthetase family protein n=1 Tax=Streptomyces sp. NBC_00539 TaxID=2975770 RepID=UPI002E80463B|nr:polyprenyl synthetase family protein [Streptomyces sp. NBC_00539]WUC68436.1 polyprenyl synthetase family protein [Streptomyces sp. NBC_00539]